MKLLSNEQLGELAEMVTHCVPAGTAWVLMMCPSHGPEEHTDAGCPLQLAANCDRSTILQLLTGAMQMFSAGIHGPMQGFKLEVGQ